MNGIDRIRIVLSGIYYPMAILRYFERALKLLPLDLITVGPYTGTHIPWAGGMYLDEKYALSPTVVLPKGQLTFEFAEENLKAEGITEWDLWIQVDAAYHLNGRPSKGIHAIIATDPHVIDYTYQRRNCDYFYNMQKSYAQKHDIVLPYAYDHTCHFPEKREKLYDVGLIGVMYSHRQALVDRLLANGIKIMAQNGPIFTEATHLWNECRIGINWSSLDDLNARTFELTAMQIPSVQNRVSAMRDFLKEDWHYIPFGEPTRSESAQMKYVDEAVRAVMRALAMSDTDLYMMAVSAYNAIEGNTYYDRIIQVLTNADLWGRVAGQMGDY